MDYEPKMPRARIGFIIPTSNRLVEPQMQRHLPDDVIPHFTRIGMTDSHKRPLEQLLPRIIEAATMLSEAKCDVTVLQCTGTSMSGGVESERQVIKDVEARTGRHVISAASAVSIALKTLGARKIVFISEAGQSLHEEKIQFLLAMGFDMLADKAAELSGSDEWCSMPGRYWYDQALNLRTDAADAYFISCANIQSIDVIADLEAELGRPVVTSNQASMWLALRKAGISDVLPRLGKLLNCDVQ